MSSGIDIYIFFPMFQEEDLLISHAEDEIHETESSKKMKIIQFSIAHNTH